MKRERTRHGDEQPTTTTTTTTHHQETDMTTITTKGLTATLRRAIKAVRDAHPRATQRLIDPADAPAITRAVRAVLRQTESDDAEVIVTARGGYVPNGYGYSAQSDEVKVRIDLAVGEIAVTAERTCAQSRPCAQGPWLIARVRRAEQPFGRRIAV